MTLVVLDRERILVTWSPPPVSQQSGEITGYTVTITEIVTGRRWIEDSRLTLLTLTNLHPFYDYEVQVKAIPASGHGLYSYGVRARTNPSGVHAFPYLSSSSQLLLQNQVGLLL